MAKQKFPSGEGLQNADDQVERELLCDLSDDELKRKADELAKADLEINKITDEARAKASAYRESIKLLKETRDPLAEQVSTRKEKRRAKCIREAIFDRSTVVVKRRDTGEIVEERAMEADERERMAQGKMPWGVIAELPVKAENDVERPRA